MSQTLVGLFGLAALFALFAIRVPVALTMLIVGIVGTVASRGLALIENGLPIERALGLGLHTALSSLSGETIEIASNYNLIVIPMFVLMGGLAGVSGMSSDLFSTAYRWIGHFRGGLASATVLACAGFSALSGSSIACAVTMGKVALPTMRKYGYDDSLATGTVAAGGTLGFLIPPSGGMIIYAVLTEQSIGALFMAGVIPGIVLTALFMLTVAIITRLNPKAGPAGPRATRQERMESLVKSIPMLAVIMVTIVGMYTGFFTPVEAAAAGAFLTGIVAAARRRLSWAAMRTVIMDTFGATATIFMILIGAFVFVPFMSMTGISADLVNLLTSLPIGDVGVLLIIIAIYLFLGTFLEDFSMLVLTMPVVLPIAAALGWDMIWFGIIVIVVLQMGLISPPVGMNVFVVKAVAKDVPMKKIFKGIWPFWFAMAVMIALLIVFPDIALFLPRTMIGG